MSRVVDRERERGRQGEIKRLYFYLSGCVKRSYCIVLYCIGCQTSLGGGGHFFNFYTFNRMIFCSDLRILQGLLT